MKKLIVPLLAVLLFGCARFSDNLFRSEQTAVNLVYGAYAGYTQALPQLHLTADQIAGIKKARLEFAASVSVLEGWRTAYETNAAVKPQAQAALQATMGQASNFVWLATYLKGTK